MDIAARKLPSLNDFFITAAPLTRMLAVSILLHAIAAVPFFTTRHGSLGGTTIAYLDLNIAGQPAPAGNNNKSAVSEESAPPLLTAVTPAPPLSELDKLQKQTQKALNDASAQPAALQEASFGLSITSGYFSSIGAGESLRDDIREYYFDMLRRINEKWWLNRESHQTGRNSAVFYLVIARNGAIMDRMLVESSGNPACDRAMLHTLEAANPLPPLPDSYRGDFFQAPLRFNMPLNLLGSLKAG